MGPGSGGRGAVAQGENTVSDFVRGDQGHGIVQKDEWLEAIDSACRRGAVSRRRWIGLRILYLLSGGKP
jgi:hypothetical protein